MRKIIIDTDPGHDDAMALMLAVKSTELDILAISTVCGNSSIQNTTRNAHYIINLLNAKDIPIYSGAEKPLKRELIQAVIHGKSGLEGIDPTNKVELTGNASDKIIELIQLNPDEITIVALGPLTNIAIAFEKEPEIMKRIKEVVLMGGAIQVPGNKNRVAEFNIFVDPEAAQIVMNFPIKKTLVPLDACNNVSLSLEDFKKIKNKSLKNTLLKMMKPYIKKVSEDIGREVAMMYDPLTVFYLLSPSNCVVSSHNIQIETRGDLTRGMTVADLRTVKDTEEKNCNVVENISEEDFKEKFISTLST